MKKRFFRKTQKKKQELTPERKRKKKRRRIIFLSILGFLIVVRLILPYFVLNYVNNKLANLEEYYGHVEDIDLHLYRGAYVIKEMNIMKREKKSTHKIPFFSSPKIDLSVEWSALFEGDLVGEITVERPVLNFVKGTHKGEDVRADTADFRQLVDDLMPLTVNRFDIHQGEIHYIDLGTAPKIDIFMSNIQATATNLTNVEDLKNVLPATLKGTGEAYEGKFNLNMKFNALAKQPTFDMNTEMKGLNLVLMNDFLRAYGNFDVKKGHFGLYAEFAAKEGKFGGYVKPIIKDIDVVQWNEEEGSVPQILWESIVGVVAEVLQNQRKEQLATKIPISGTFSDPKVDTWKALSYILRNAFIQALKPTIDESINIYKLKEEKRPLFENVFGKRDKTRKEERKENRKRKRQKN